MENAELVDSVCGACGERGFVQRCSCLGQIPGACALLRVLIVLFSGFALALAWVFDGAVFGSFSCLEGQFPRYIWSLAPFLFLQEQIKDIIIIKVFPFTLIKSVDCSADLRVTSSVHKQQLREDASQVTENVYLVRPTGKVSHMSRILSSAVPKHCWSSGDNAQVVSGWSRSSKESPSACLEARNGNAPRSAALRSSESW